MIAWELPSGHGNAHYKEGEKDNLGTLGRLLKDITGKGGVCYNYDNAKKKKKKKYYIQENKKKNALHIATRECERHVSQIHGESFIILSLQDLMHWMEMHCNAEQCKRCELYE